MIELASFERLEQVFASLSVGFEQRVIDVHRMRILRRFGQELRRIDQLEPRPTDDEVHCLCVAALAEIYEQCRRGMRETVPYLAFQEEKLVRLRLGPDK